MERAEIQGFDISEKTVALIGCGGLGCNVAVHLVGAGIGKLILCDFDTVSRDNLNRQFLYTENSVGKKKCLEMKHRLSEYNTQCEIVSVDRKIENTADLCFCKGCDIIILAVDNIPARETVMKFCFENNVPLVNGGINGFYGNSYLCIPEENACLDCAGLLKAGYGKEKSVSSTAGVIGAHCVQLTEKYLCGDFSQSGRLFVYDSGEISSVKIQKKTSCRCCGNISDWEM